MRKLCLLGLALALAGSARAAPNVANTSQKGSLLIWPDIRVDVDPNVPAVPWRTLIRIQNDGVLDVDVQCYWMDGNKNRVDFNFEITANAALWFDAGSGTGSTSINPFPLTSSNGFDNPFLITPPFVDEAADDVPAPPQLNSLPYRRGMLACWAVDDAAINQVKYNHLSGTATVWHAVLGAYEYNAYAFFVPTGLDLQPVCSGPQPPCVPTPGVLRLNGIEYDQCPIFIIGQFTPENVPPGVQPPEAPIVQFNRLAISGCTLTLNQDWVPVYTKLEFEVWNEDESKRSGAYECADSWHETEFNAPPTVRSGGWIDAAAQNFDFSTLQTYSARYRVHAVKSTQCEDTNIITQTVGILGVQSSFIGPPGGPNDFVGSTLAVSGKVSGRIVWDSADITPEGAVR